MRHQAGFTLIEMLVVIGLIAMFSTLAVMHLPASRSGIDRVADRLAADLYRASRHSIISGKVVGWEVETGLFSSYWRGEWKPVTGLGAARDKEAAAVEYELVEAETESGYVVFAPTGESSPARIRIVLDTDTRLLSVGAAGQIEQERTEP